MRLRILLVALLAWSCGSGIRAEDLLTTQTLTLHSRPAFFNSSFHAWETELDLHGRSLILSFESQDGKLDNRDMLDLRPSGRKASPVTTFFMARRIFYNGRNYELSFGPIPAQKDSPLTATIREIALPMGICEFTGGHVERLVLQSPTKYDSVEIAAQIAIFDAPATGPLSLPAGTYEAHAFITGNFNVGTVSSYSKRFTVTPQTGAKLQIGSPLKNTISATRKGDRLLLEYMMQDSGDHYCHTVFSTNWPMDWRPAYAVYKGPLKIASGQFGEPLDRDSNLYSLMPPGAKVTIPPFLFGKLSIHVTQALGDLGPATSAADFNWQWEGSLLQLIPWAMLLALLGLKPNRRPAAWLALLPIVSAHIVFFIARAVIDDDYFLHMSQTWAFSVVFGLCALWLVAPLLAPMRPAKAAAAALIGVAVASCFMLVARLGFGADRLKLIYMYLPISICVATSAAAALILAGLLARRQFTPKIFLGTFSFFHAALCAVTLGLFFAAFTICTKYPLHQIPFAAYPKILQIELPGVISVVFGISLFSLILLLPFPILTLASRTHRDRFRAIFRL